MQCESITSQWYRYCHCLWRAFKKHECPDVCFLGAHNFSELRFLKKILGCNKVEPSDFLVNKWTGIFYLVSSKQKGMNTLEAPVVARRGERIGNCSE